MKSLTFQSQSLIKEVRIPSVNTMLVLKTKRILSIPVESHTWGFLWKTIVSSNTAQNMNDNR